MKQLTTLFALFWLLAAFASPAQAGPKKLYTSISSITDAHACGVSELTLTFSNSGPTAQINNVAVDLDNKHDGLITLLGISNSPHFHIASGQGTSNPTFTYDQPLPSNAVVTLTLQVQYACDFFNMPDDLNEYFAKASVHWQISFPTPGSFWEEHQSPNYNIGYTAITPKGNLDAMTVNYETPFDITIPLEVSGNYCDNDFTVTIDKRHSCYDFSGLSYSILRKGITYGPFVLPAQQGPFFLWEVNAQAIGIPTFCRNNYPDGLGQDITLVIHNMVVRCGCGMPGDQNDLRIGFSSCEPSNATNADCQKTVLQSVTPQVPPAGKLTITNVSSNTFDLSNPQNIWSVRISNTSENPVYDIDLSFLNAFGYQITQAAFANNQVILNNPASPQMQLNFDENTLSNIGLQDLNGDGFFAELDGHQSFQVSVHFSAPTPHCGLGTDNACTPLCQTTHLEGFGLEASAQWTNRCGSLDIPDATTLGYGVDVAPLVMNVSYNGAKLSTSPPLPEPQQYRTVKMELNFGSFSGFTGYLDQGTLQRYICINANLNCINYANVRLNGMPIQPTINNGLIVLGAVAPDDLDNTIVEFDFSINCCPLDLSLIALKLSYGVFFEGTNCFIQMACGDANFLSPCSGNGSNCEYFSKIQHEVYNTIYEPLDNPVPVPAKVYPCDCLRMDVSATFAQNAPGSTPLIGVMISDEFVGHIKSPYTFSGALMLDNEPLVFQDGQLAVIPDEPFDIIYFESNLIDLIGAGQTISGHFYICMDSDFPSGFDKMDFFTPVFGLINKDQEKLFCYQGYTDLYAMEPSYSLEEGLSVSCGTGGVYTARLIKHGGELFGPDFPDYPRVVAQIDGEVTITIAGGNTAFQGRAGLNDCTPLGNPFNFPVISSPTGLEVYGDVLQSFSAYFDENCDGSAPITAEFNVLNRPGSNAPCSYTEQLTKNASASQGGFPKIVTSFDPVLGGSEILADNSFEINISTANAGVDAENAWIQLEYDPSQIEIDWTNIVGATSGPVTIINDNCNKYVLVIPIGNLANGNMTLTHTIPLRFLEASCATTPSIELYGFHQCGCTPPTKYGCASNYSDPAGCEDSFKRLTFDFFDSDLLLQYQTCVVADVNCGQSKAAFIIENPGEGNTSNVILKVMLPPGMTITSASYGIGTNYCANGNVPVNINALTTTGWTIPQGKLFGLQSGQPNNLSSGYLVLLFSGTGVSTANDDVTLVASGVKPCGEKIERSATLSDIASGWTTSTMGSLFFRPNNLCTQNPPPPQMVTVEVTVHVIADVYTPQLGYLNARIICDANDNGIAESNEPVLFTSATSFGSPYQLNRVGNTQTYSGIWGMAGDFLSCAGHNAILTFQYVWTSDPEILTTCTAPAIGPICGDQAPAPGSRSNWSDDVESTKHAWHSQVQPNPFTNQLTLSVSAPQAEKVETVVFNQLGAKVFSNSYPVENQGNTTIDLGLTDLPPGMYVLRVAANGDMKHHVLIKH